MKGRTKNTKKKSNLPPLSAEDNAAMKSECQWKLSYVHGGGTAVARRGYPALPHWTKEKLNRSQKHNSHQRGKHANEQARLASPL